MGRGQLSKNPMVTLSILFCIFQGSRARKLETKGSFYQNSGVAIPICDCVLRLPVRRCAVDTVCVEVRDPTLLFPYSDSVVLLVDTVTDVSSLMIEKLKENIISYCN